MKRYKVTFKYYDKYCRDGRWGTQAGTFNADTEAEAVRACIKFYGLGVDCDYKIVSVEEVN